jgi:hypothetical protein
VGVIEVHECIGFVLWRSSDDFSCLSLLNEMLFSLFKMTCVGAQESFILFKCHILHKMILWPQMLYYQILQENDLSM